VMEFVDGESQGHPTFQPTGYIDCLESCDLGSGWLGSHSETESGPPGY
jgi:hypothetical protein